MSFGFIIDGGELLAKKFSGASMDMPLDKWKNLLKRLELPELDNVVFSQWRYFNHWTITPMKKKDFEWFILALERMAELTEK